MILVVSVHIRQTMKDQFHQAVANAMRGREKQIKREIKRTAATGTDEKSDVKADSVKQTST